MEWPTRRQIREKKSVVRGVEIVDTVRHDDERDLYSRERVFLDIDGFSVHFHYLDVEHSVAKRIDPIIDAALPRQPEKKRP